MVEAISSGLLEKEMFPKTSSTIALIDADSLLYYCMGESTFEEAKLKLDLRMSDILTECDTSLYAAFLTPYKHFRREVAYTRPYKGNRKGKLAPPALYGLKAYAEQEWNFRYVEGLEADDVVALYNRSDTIICSPDKDVLKQIPGRHYNYGGKENERWVDTTIEEAFYFLWIQTMSGDSTDGIPGIAGIGPKKAEKALLNIKKGHWPLQTLKMYLESEEDVKKAVDKFKETLDLVYINRTAHDRDRLKYFHDIQIPSMEEFDVLDLFEDET